MSWCKGKSTFTSYFPSSFTSKCQKHAVWPGLTCSQCVFVYLVMWSLRLSKVYRGASVFKWLLGAVDAIYPNLLKQPFSRFTIQSSCPGFVEGIPPFTWAQMIVQCPLVTWAIPDLVPWCLLRTTNTYFLFIRSGHSMSAAALCVLPIYDYIKLLMWQAVLKGTTDIISLHFSLISTVYDIYRSQEGVGCNFWGGGVGFNLKKLKFFSLISCSLATFLKSTYRHLETF